MVRRFSTILLALLVAAPGGTHAAGVDVTEAWTPPLTQTKVDAPLYLTIHNPGAAPDTLLRIRCPSVADFVEKHATDRGEGGLAMREIKTIDVPAGEATILAPEKIHLMLLHTHQSLESGASFECTLTFKQAGTVTVTVAVAAR